MQQILPIHSKVSGRTRFKVSGLRQAPAIKAFLEQALAGQSDIATVSANTVTGTLLITYNSGNTPQTIAGRIEAALVQWEHGAHPAATPVYRPPVPISGSIHPAVEETPFANEHWHGLDRDKILDLLKTHGERGLSTEVWQAYYRQYGPNLLPQSEKRSKWEMLFDQFTSLPVYLLAGASAISLATGGFLEAAVILGVVAANAAIGFATESKAEKTIQALSAGPADG
jgi:Ca2+-transporting ATPase